jgi:hypothetical protein
VGFARVHLGLIFILIPKLSRANAKPTHSFSLR